MMKTAMTTLVELGILNNPNSSQTF